MLYCLSRYSKYSLRYGRMTIAVWGLCLEWRSVCMPCSLYRSFVFYKVPLGPWNHKSPRGAFTLLGPDSIYQIPLWFLVTLVTKLQPMPNHWSHSLDSGSFT